MELFTEAARAARKGIKLFRVWLWCPDSVESSTGGLAAAAWAFFTAGRLFALVAELFMAFLALRSTLLIQRVRIRVAMAPRLRAFEMHRATALAYVIDGDGPSGTLLSACAVSLVGNWLGRLFDNTYDCIADFVIVRDGGFASVLPMHQ